MLLNEPEMDSVRGPTSRPCSFTPTSMARPRGASGDMRPLGIRQIWASAYAGFIRAGR